MRLLTGTVHITLIIWLLHPAFLLFTCSCTLIFASCTIEVVPYSQDEFSGIKLILLVNLINIADHTHNIAATFEQINALEFDT